MPVVPPKPVVPLKKPVVAAKPAVAPPAAKAPVKPVAVVKKPAPAAPVAEPAEEVAEEGETEAKPKRAAQMTEEERVAAIQEYLAALNDTDEQGDKRKYRAKLRALGHRGGLAVERKAAREAAEAEAAEAEEAAAPAAPAAPAAKPAAKKPIVPVARRKAPVVQEEDVDADDND